MAAQQRFEIIYQEETAAVVELALKKGRVFHVSFAKPRAKPLVITVAEDTGGKKFWTSLPEGRQDEAEAVGRLVANHIRSHR